MIRHHGLFQVLVGLGAERARVRIDAGGTDTPTEERGPELLRRQPQCHRFLGQSDNRVTGDAVKTRAVQVEHVARRQDSRLPAGAIMSVDHPAGFIAANSNTIRGQRPKGDRPAGLIPLYFRVSVAPEQAMPQHGLTPCKGAHLWIRLNVQQSVNRVGSIDSSAIVPQRSHNVPGKRRNSFSDNSHAGVNRRQTEGNVLAVRNARPGSAE